jgi:hypothetical protein
MSFQLKLREDRPATIEEHRALRAEVERLRHENERLKEVLAQAAEAIGRVLQ